MKMSQEIRIALDVAQRIATLYEESPARLWYPRLSLSWLGVPPGPYITNEDGIPLQISGTSSGRNDYITTGEPDPEVGLSYGETRQAFAERGLALDFDRPRAQVHYTHIRAMKVNPGHGPNWRMGCSKSLMAELVDKLCSLPFVLRIRLMLSKYHRVVHHSDHFKHAMKNAIGVAILTFPAFMPADSAGTLVCSSSVLHAIIIYF